MLLGFLWQISRVNAALRTAYRELRKTSPSNGRDVLLDQI